MLPTRTGFSMAEPYKRGNKFVPWISIDQAAVEWQGLSIEQEELVLVTDGIPFLAGVPDLQERAEALLDAAQAGRIVGRTHTEDGLPLRANQMRLDKASLHEWLLRFEKTSQTSAFDQPQAIQHQDSLLTESEVLELLKISRATLSRLRVAHKFPEPEASGPNRWRNSTVQKYIETPEKFDLNKPLEDI